MQKKNSPAITHIPSPVVWLKRNLSAMRNPIDPISSGQDGPRHQEQLWFKGHGSIERLCQFNLCLTGWEVGKAQPFDLKQQKMRSHEMPRIIEKTVHPSPSPCLRGRRANGSCVYSCEILKLHLNMEYLDASFTEYPQPPKLRTWFSISNPWYLWKKMLRIDQNCPCRR